MKLPFVCTLLILTARLTLAPGAGAQTTDDDEPPQAVPPPRVEIGGTTGLAMIFPEVGVIASVPVQRNSAIEVMVSRLPASWDGPPHLLAQLQMRVPFRDDLRSRKSLVVGVTRISAERRDDGFLGTDEATFMRPHAGLSLQWPTAPTLDFRLDVQGIFTFSSEVPMLPRAVAAFVWHPRMAR
jgi:hypothetical protein